MLQHQQIQQPPLTVVAGATPAAPLSGEATGEAPPEQVAMAMDRLGQAARLIADIRLGADRLLEAILVSSESYQSSKTINFILEEDSTMRLHLQDLRNVGRQLEASGVLNEALRSRSNSWGLHMPLVCPDGAVGAYAWKRQLAGQAGASAVDRTRLALKSFSDQRKRFFPHLDCESASKKQCISQESVVENPDEPGDDQTLANILKFLENEVPNMKIFSYERLEWLKRASSLPTTANEGSFDTIMEHSHGTSNLRPVAYVDGPSDRVAVIELLVPSVFRAVVSLHPVGSKNPDAVAFFSPDEDVIMFHTANNYPNLASSFKDLAARGGSYVHARGISVYHAYRHITELSNIVLQYFVGTKPESALHVLLHWISTYQSLYTQACSKCGRVLSMDRQLALFLPPVHRPYRYFSAAKVASTSTKDLSLNLVEAYHVSCSPPDV